MIRNVRVWGRFLLLTLPLAALVLLSAYLFTQSEQEVHLSAVRLETEHHIESQAKNVREEIKRAALHAKFLAQHSEMPEVLLGDEDALDELSNDFRSFAKFMGVYDQVRLLDVHGHEVLRANFSQGKVALVAADKLQDKSHSSYVRYTMAMPPDDVFISKFDLNRENGKIEQPLKPVIRYAVAVLDSDGDKIGLVVLNYLGEVLIRRYLDATEVLGETMLLNANSFFIHAPDAADRWGSVIDSRAGASLADRYPAVWESMVEHRKGQMLTDAGLFTFATVSPYTVLGQKEPAEYGAGDWIVVSYVPNDELYAGSMVSSQHFNAAVLILFILWVLLAWLWARSEAKRELTWLRLQEVSDKKRQLLRNMLHMQESERHTLARALHDEMGQALTSIQAYAASIGGQKNAENIENAVQYAHQIRDITSQLQQMVRHRLHDLRPSSLDRLGLCAALEDMLGEFGQRESISCEFACQDDIPELNDEQRIQLYRIVQESLTNVSKYAHAEHVSVRLSMRQRYLHLHIEDDGCGVANIEERGFGLLGMRERAELLNGHIEFQSRQGKGMAIDVEIPLGDAT